MILVVGHGPSANDPEFIDAQDFVVRLFTGTHKHPKGTYTPHLGRKIDVIVTTRPKNIFEGYDWWLESDYRDQLQEMAKGYTERKLSTGVVGCLIAHLKYPDEVIGVVGFDTTLYGKWHQFDWPYHDAEGEGKLLRDIGVRDYGIQKQVPGKD